MLLLDDVLKENGLLADNTVGDAREVFSKLDYLWARLAVHISAGHLRRA